MSSRLLWKSRLKIYTLNILYFAFNFLHIALASTSKITKKGAGLLRFKIDFFSEFNFSAFFIALGVVLVQITISYLILVRQFKRQGIFQITEKGINEADVEERAILKNLSIEPKLIYQWVKELAKEQKIRSISRIYLMDTNIPNALTLDILPIPFIRRSWIVLDVNILEILEEREIKAVISHELGHVKRYDSFMNLFRFGLNYFIFIAYSVSVLTMLYHIIAALDGAVNRLLRIGFLVVVILLIFLFTAISQILMALSRSEAELLADHYAAKKIGRNHMINALVLLGQRLEVVFAFAVEFKWLGNREKKENLTRELLQGLKTLPSEELSEKISREKAVRIYLSNRLKNLREELHIPFTDEQIEEFTNNAAEKLLEIRKKEIKNGTATDRKIATLIDKLTIDWRLADKDQDLYLNDQEVDQLVKTIESNPEKELFEDELQKRRFGISVHPTLKARILFLYHTIPKNN